MPTFLTTKFILIKSKFLKQNSFNQFRIFFKPTATVLDTAKKGRHDPCIIPRAIPVLEAMALMVLVDHILWQRQDRA